MKIINASRMATPLKLLFTSSIFIILNVNLYGQVSLDSADFKKIITCLAKNRDFLHSLSIEDKNEPDTIYIREFGNIKEPKCYQFKKIKFDVFSMERLFFCDIQVFIVFKNIIFFGNNIEFAYTYDTYEGYVTMKKNRLFGWRIKELKLIYSNSMN